MSRRLIRWATAASILSMVFAPGAVGQEATDLVIDSVDVSEYPTVSLVASIPQNELAGGTPAIEFRENGKLVEAAMELEASEGLEIALLLDVSGSMRGEPLAAAQKAATDFIDAMPESVDVAVIAFGSAPTLAAEFSNDRDYLTSSVEGLTARGETALYDGLLAATDLLSASERSLKTIVMVSDGGDTVSNADLETAARALTGIGASLYSIELQSPENDREALDTLAAAVGGSVFSAEESDLGAVFESITAQLLTRFRITYVSQAEGETQVSMIVDTAGGVASATAAVTLPVLAPPAVEEPAPAPPTPEPVLRGGETLLLSWWDSEQALWLGIGALFIAMAVTVIMMTLPKPAENVLRADPSRLGEYRPNALTSLAHSATNLAETTLTKTDRLTPLNAALERAGLAMRPAELVVMVVSFALGAGAVGFLLGGSTIAVALALAVPALVKLRLGSMAERRARDFADQLSDTLQLMASSMRAGYGLLQAIDSVAAEAPAPASDEFQRIKVETQLGREVEDSMKAAAERVQSEDFKWVAESIEIHRQIGGDLAEILDAVNETIRDRNRIRRRIRALSAEGRLSGVILSLIPLFLIVVILIFNRSYLNELTGTTPGRVMMGLGLLAWSFAVLWMRRLVRLVF